jgi:hypothetical protein
MNTTTATSQEIQIAEFRMIQAYATAGLSKLGILSHELKGSAEYHNYWHVRTATERAEVYAKLVNRDFYEVRDEMLDRFIFTN